VATFQQLQAEGFVSSEVSAGTFVVPAPELEMTSPAKQRSSRQAISRATIAKRTPYRWNAKPARKLWS
jgi:hypothetical protein